MGPLFYYELVRLARRGRSNLLRCGYALALFAALFLAYHASFPGHDPWSRSFKPAKPLPAQEMSRLAESFVYVILWVQTVAVFVLAPVYIGGAIAEERDRGTLDLLHATELSDREIVLGKLFARSAHLGGVLLAGLPLLALTQLWGGVDFRLLVAAFLASGLNLLSVGAICIWRSATDRKATLAIYMSYSFTMGKLWGCTALAGTPAEIYRVLSVEVAGPAQALKYGVFVSFVDGRGVLLPLATCLAVNGIVILWFSSAAVANLKRRRSRPDERIPDDAVVPPRSPRTLPPVGDRPLLWKERNRGTGQPAAEALERLFLKAPSRGFLLVGVLAVTWFTARLSVRDYPDGIQALGIASRGVMVFLAGLWCGMAAFRAASSISAERDGRTLDVLLSSPISHASLLGANWLGAVLSGRVFGYGLALLAVVELVGGDWHPLGVFLLLVMVAGHVALLAGFGVWLSLVSRNTLRARVVMVVVLLFLGGGLTLLIAALGLSPAPSWLTMAIDVVDNAPRTWWSLAFTWNDFAKRAAGDGLLGTRLNVTAGGILFLPFLAGLFWLSAWRRCETGRAC